MASTPINTSMTPAPVLDAQANQILKDIYSFLNKQNDQNRSDSDSLQSGIDNLTDRIDRDNKLSRSEVKSNNKAVVKALTGIANGQNKESARSSQSNARDRATNQIFNNKINKNVDGFKNTLLKTLGDLKDFLKTQILACLEKSLRSFTDLAKTMRRANMTRAQKAQIQLMADSAIGDVSSKFDGLNVSKDEIIGFIEELISSGKDLSAMSADQKANYIALRKRGLDDEAAFNKAMTATSDQIKGTVLAMGDPAIAASLKKAQSNITNSMASVAGGTGKAMEQMTENIRGIESELGNALSPESAAKLATVQFKLQNGLIAEMTDEEKMLASITNGATDAKSIAEALKGADLTTLARLGKVSEDFANIANFQNSGTPLGKTVRSDADNREANSQNTTNGKLSQFGDKLTSRLDLATGGMFSKTANILDEYLGDSADINAVVKNGFKLVLVALKSISINTSGMGKLLMGLGGAAAVIAIVANWDKIKPKLAPLLNAVKDVAKDIIANLPSFITDAIAGIKSVFSDIFKGGLFGGGSSALSGAKSFVSDTASSLSGSMSGVDISQNVKELGSSIGSLFGSVMDWIKQALPGLGRILHDIIGCINNAINAVAPALSDICDVLRAAVDGIIALGISIVDCVRELGISIVDCVKELGVSLIEGTRDVLLSIAPTINSIAHAIEVLCEALAPVIPTIVDMLKFATETILPPLVNKLIPRILDLFDKIVQNILPPLLAIIKKAVEIILPPMMDILKTVANTLLPPLQEALSVIVGIVDRILNLILDILEPPLRAISEAISSIIDVVTSVAIFITDIVDTAHGLFNYFTSKIPDLIGWISGLFNWLKDGFGPVISSGISVIKDTMNVLWAGLKEIIAIAISPIIMAVNAVDVALTSIKLFLAEAPIMGSASKAEQYREDLDKAMFKLNGADRGGVEEANYKAAKEAFEEALKNGNKAEIEKTAAAYKKASSKYQSEAGSKITAAKIDRLVETASLEKSLDKFKEAITSDTLLKGPQKDEAAKEEVLQYLSGQKGNIAAESVLPPNTGGLLDSIKQSSTGIFTIIKSIHDTLVNYITSEKNIPAYGSGTRNGPISTPTKVIVGDKGPEHIIPTKSSSAAKRVLSAMSNFEKNLIATALNGSGFESSDVPGDDKESIMKILELAGKDAGEVYNRLLHGWKGNVKNGFKQRKKWYEEAKANAANQEGRDLIKGTFAEKALEFGVSELGKPYLLRSLGRIGYVCNELFNASIKASGFNMGKFMVHGVNATFANIQKGKYSGNDYPNFKIRDDLTPETATPGMVFFQDSRKAKDGSFNPSHIGLVYYGHQKLHSSGGAAAGCYTEDKFLQNWQTPCRGVTVTPFDNGNYVIGEFPGLFESISGEPINRNTGSGSSGESIVSDEITQALQSLETVNGYALNPNGEIFDRESYNAYLKEKFGDNADAFNTLNSDLKQLSSEAVTSAARASSGEQWYVINKYLGNINNSSQLYDLYVSVAEAVKYLREISSRVKQKQSTPVKPVRAPAS